MRLKPFRATYEEHRTMSLRTIVLASFLFATACASVPPQTALIPLADHHQHLVSPAAAKLVAADLQPAIAVPAELAALLHAREQHWNDRAGLNELYVEDALLFNQDEPEWIRGRDKVAEYVSGRFARAYRITPVAYSTSGDSGYIAAYFTRGEGAAAKHFGQVLFSIARASDGKWRIAAETPAFPGPRVREPRTADQLIAALDAAHIQRAAVLSTAYWFGSPFFPKVDNEYEKVRAENDWTASEVERYPGRLIALCSFNPLKDYALEELDRCAKSGRFRGLKLHFGNSKVDLLKPEHVARMREIFRAANARHLAIVAHLWTGPEYGAEQAKVFLAQLLPEAPDIVVQIAHFAGGGPGYTDSALGVYADAIAAHDPRTKNLYFDIATVADEQTDAALQTFADRIRQVGLKRVLYGTDLGPPQPRQSWANIRATVPLTDDELRVIASNVAPYFKQ